MKRRPLARLVAIAGLVAGCGGTEPSADDYDRARDAIASELVAPGTPLTISDAEIDCISDAYDISVRDIADGDTRTNESDDQTFHCFSAATARSFFADLFNSVEPLRQGLAERGIELDCAVDNMVAAFEIWKPTDDSFGTLMNELSSALSACE